ncbi:Lysosome membrane protein 2-like protein [Leptotrombidium deliense]|uniref:Lysosome membrane protein 2-like protein n=1 Tax=Leptotrombidium deliense TaxID=299467 RepID=A0A443SIJ6_9ACAR|nr:Lysosome membrane protein 2-like protein [Leptotrombidium deliense]
MYQKSAGKIAFLGVALVTIGTALIFSFSSILEFGVRHLQQLRRGSDAFQKWIELPIPLTIQFYIFEVINPRDVINGAKPILKERGPEWRKKEIIEYSEDGTRVKYWETKTYIFDPLRSVGSVDDEITIINAPMVSIGSFVEKVAQDQRGSHRNAHNMHTLNFSHTLCRIKCVLGTLTFGVLNILFAMYRTNLFIKKTPQELLFDGYRVRELDTLLTLAKPIEALGILEIPRVLPNNTFGLFYQRNATREAFYEVYTGTGDYSHKFTHYVSYRDKSKLDFWKGHFCNMINGTDGVMFQPFITKNDTLYVFAFDLCRSIHLKFLEETEVKGIPTYRFSPPTDMFYGPHKNKDNFCFCPWPETPEKCYLDGVLDISSCWKGAPIVLSNPHFLGSSADVYTSVEGLNPDPNIHTSYLDIEPRVGAVLKAHRRLQVNVKLDRITMLRQMGSLREQGIVPLLWLDESAEIDSAIETELNLKLMYPVKLGEFSFPAMIVAGIALIFASAFVFCCGKRDKTLVSA